MYFKKRDTAFCFPYNVPNKLRVVSIMLPIYFSGLNINKGVASSLSRSGELLRFARGVYFPNVFSDQNERYAHLEPETKAVMLETSARFYAPWIVSYSSTNSTLVASSAYFVLPDADGRLFIKSSGNGRKTILGEEFAKECNTSDYEIQAAIQIERIRSANEYASKDVVTTTLPSSILDNTDLYRYLDANELAEGKLALSQFTMEATSEARTLLDICYWPKTDAHSLNDADFIDLAGFCGITFDPDRYAEDRQVLADLVKNNWSNPKSLLELKRRIEPLFLREDLTSEQQEHLERVRLNSKIDTAENRFDIYHYDNPVGELVNLEGNSWAVTGDGWIMPVHQGVRGLNPDLPPLVKNLMPEMIEITPPQYLAFFNQNPRFLSNIQVISSGMPKYKNDYLTESLDMSSSLFRGAIGDLPVMNNDFERKMVAQSLNDHVPRLSGVQLKLPMSLSAVAGEKQLSVAASKPFTHILKIPNESNTVLVIAEWMGMKVAEASGCKVPKFQLVDLPNVGRQSLGYLVERFDIGEIGDPAEYLSIDLCGLSGIDPKSKYNSSMEEVAVLLQNNTQNFAEERIELAKLLISTVLSENTDLHLKNIGLIRDAKLNQEDGYQLSPVYDMVVTSAVPGFEHGKLALGVNGRSEPSLEDLLTYCDTSLNIPSVKAKQLVEDACIGVLQFLGTVEDIFPAELAAVEKHKHDLHTCMSVIYSQVNKLCPHLCQEINDELKAQSQERPTNELSPICSAF